MSRYIRWPVTDECHALFCGDVLHHEFEFRKACYKWTEYRLNEYFFAIKDIYVWIGHFAMH